MATSEQGGGGGGEATMFSDLGVDVSKVVREVVKESLVPLIQRVMLKIDALDGKVKQMQLVLEEMEEDGRERDVEREARRRRRREEEKHEDEESEESEESEVGGLDIEELQALLNQKLAMESKKKKNKKKKGDGENMLLYGDGGYRQQQSGVPPPSSASTVYGAAPPPVHHHHVAPGSSSSSSGPPLLLTHLLVGALLLLVRLLFLPLHMVCLEDSLMVKAASKCYDERSRIIWCQPSATTSGSYTPGYQPAPPTGPPPPVQQHQQPSSSSGSVPIEKVIDDIAIMGFSREEVRNVLRELTAQGKSVDMNIVLDRLGAR
eukprot:jgi/Picre1/34581/NNA_002049.t1